MFHLNHIAINNKADNHKDSSNLYYQIQKTNDSTIYFFDQPCKRIGSKRYKINNKLYVVTSYFYDVENSIDEEATMYFNENFGLLLVYSNGWVYLSEVFEYNDVSNLLCKAIIKDTTNDIFLYNKEKINTLLE